MKRLPSMPSAPLSVRARRWWRLIRHGSPVVRSLAIAMVVLLAIDLGVVGARSGSSSKVSANRGPGAKQGGNGSGSEGTVEPGSTQTALGGTGTGTATGGSGGGGSGGGGSSNGGGSGSISVGSGSGPGGVPLTASDRGVTPTSIRVVFPWPNLSTINSAFSLSGTATSGEDDVTSIKTYVDDINAHGGILGRKIDPEIVSYDPSNDADMKAKCQQWTQVEKVFAVVDEYAWHDDNQLCITQQGHTPLISGWTSIERQLELGAPYLWWTGPEQIATLENLVAWAKATGVLTSTTKFGIVYADRSNDAIVRQQFSAVLSRAHLRPTDVETMHFDITDQSQAEAQGAIAVHNLQSKNVTVVFPLIPFTTYAVYLTNEKSQSYYPRLLLSDFEQSVSASLGLLDSGAFDQPLQDQVGTTTMVLGDADGPRATSSNSPGYPPQGQDCDKVFGAHNPNYQGTQGNPWHGHIESTGIAAIWCQNIRLLATAARMAGTTLTRDGFNAAMAQISSFPGTVVPDLSYAPGRYWGPHLYRVVDVHKNNDNRCPPTEYQPHAPQGTCWLILKEFQPMQTI